MTIAITGASGQLGRLIIDQLIARQGAADLIGLARAPEAANLPVRTRAADYDHPGTLGPALAGVDTLMLISGNEIGRRTPQHRAVIEAAQAAGVRRIVYTSLLHADRSPLSLADEHRETEAMLHASGLAVTILRNGWYQENHTGSIPATLSLGTLYGAAGAGRIAAAARADYAEAAAVVLTGAWHEGQTYELAGAPAFTLAELAAEISRQTGREIPFVNLPEADYAAALAGAGVPAGFAAKLASFDALAADGALMGDGTVLARLIGRPSRPLADAVAAALPE
ncbi:MAG: NAD(P)H-binding protein [Paracoccus sp. (in: a-proteobacteria)]|uniref:NAD(P)H-binding protein n=1 Tax=Paracoccus sp. TaxID=267 RepID=UPI00391DBE85